MNDDSSDYLRQKTKDELVSIILQLRKKNTNTEKVESEENRLKQFLNKFYLPVLLVNPLSWEIVYQNEALSKSNIVGEQLLKNTHFKEKIKQLPAFFQWKYCQFEKEECELLVYAQEIEVEQNRYFLLKFWPVSEENKKHPINLEDKHFLVNALKIHNIGIWYFDMKNHVCYMNEGNHIKMELPYRDEPYSLEELRTLIYPEDLEVFYSMEDSIHSIRGMIEFEGRLVSYVHKKVSHNTFKFFPIIKNDEVIAIWGTVAEVSKRKAGEDYIRADATFTQQMDQSLKKKNNILNVLEKNVKVAWWYLNHEKSFMEFSENWEEVAYLSRDHFHKVEDFLNTVHPEDRKHLEGVVRRIFSGEPNTQCTYRLIHPEKPVKYIYAANVIINQEVYGILHDITDLKVSEFNLKAAEANYREVLDSLDEMIIRFKPDSTLTFVNAAYARFFKKKREELVGTRFLEIIPEYVREEVKAKLAKLAKHKKTLSDIHKIYDDGINSVWHRITDYPILDENGELKEIQTIGIDITDKVVANNKLRESEQMYRMLAEGSSDIIFLLDKELNLSYINPAVYEVLGYKEEEILSIPLDKIVTQETINEAQMIYGISLQENVKQKFNPEVKTWKTPLIRKDGKRIWGEIAITPLTDGINKFTGLLGIIRDISDRKQYEDQLLRANKELADLIEEKNKFLSMVSHDIKTPLNSLMGMVYLLKNQLNPIPQAEILETLDFSANHLKSLVNNLLDLSSLQQRKIKLEKRAFMLSWLLKNCINAFHFHASDKNIQLRHEFLNIDEVKVIGDPDRLYQIINNLLSNAIKFTEQGSVDLIVALSALNNSRYSISVVVRDTGPGIEKKYLSRIFEPFVRVHTDNMEGSGCGLAIVKELVDLFDGSIKVESELQKGTKFKVDFELPSASGDAKEGLLHSDLSVAEASLEGVSILYVEDLEFNQKLLSTYAKLWKFDLHIVDNALEAIKLLYRKKFDMVLMDIFLPSLQGDEATRMIRKAEKQEKIDANNIILAVTALEDISNPEWLGKNGFNDIIPKPIDPSLLYQKLKWWSRKQSPDLSTYAEQNSAQTKLFHNLKSTFNGESDNLKNLLKSFKDDLDTQMESLSLAIQADDQSSYSKTRHNLSAMLAMLNEIELREYLVNNKSIPKTTAEKKEAQNIIKDHITRIQTLITAEVEK